jgi:hypothetical protein
MYSADNVWIIGRRQNKKGTEIEGYDFIINVEKSRFVKEKSKIPVSVTWKGGIKKNSGLLDVAVEGGFVVKPSNGWYSKVDLETGEVEDKKVRASETEKDSFWTDILSDDKFRKFVERKYAIGHHLLADEDGE